MTTAPVDTKVAGAGLIEFLETGTAPEGLFAPDLFLDLSLPQWRLQTATDEEAMAVRVSGHPCAGQVRVERRRWSLRRGDRSVPV
jgi:hypothetical protein